MDRDFENMERVQQPIWGVFFDHKGNFDCMFLGIVEGVSGKNRNQEVAALFPDKEEAEFFASACVKKWPDKDFYVRECEVVMKL